MKIFAILVVIVSFLANAPLQPAIWAGHQADYPQIKVAIPDADDYLESRKLALEIDKFAYQKTRDQAIQQAEERARIWAQLSTAVPILVLILSFFTNALLERRKSISGSRQEQLRFDREFIDKQLSNLYYPLRFKLEKDSAVWTLSKQLSPEMGTKTSPEFSAYIDTAIVIPNHEEAITILEKNLSLIKNGRETYDPEKLIKAINHFQRHVAAYKALRGVGDTSINPIQLGGDADFPEELPTLIVDRIKDLETQRALLSDDLRGKVG